MVIYYFLLVHREKLSYLEIINSMSKPTPSGSLGRLVGASLGKNVV